MKQNTISNNNKSWTDPEVQVLKRIVKHARCEGRHYKDAFEQAAFRLERTYGAVYAFWVGNVDSDYKQYVKSIDKLESALPAKNKLESALPAKNTYGTAVGEAFERASTHITPEFVDAGDTDEYHADKHPEQYHPPEDDGDTRYNLPRLPPRASDEDVLALINSNPIYKATHDAMHDAQRRQVAYGLDKYPEPLNADTWTIIETIDHIISETADKLHYLTMLKIKLQQGTEDKT